MRTVKLYSFELNQVFVITRAIDCLHIEYVITNLCPNEFI